MYLLKVATTTLPCWSPGEEWSTPELAVSQTMTSLPGPPCCAATYHLLLCRRCGGSKSASPYPSESVRRLWSLLAAPTQTAAAASPACVGAARRSLYPQGWCNTKRAPRPDAEDLARPHSYRDRVLCRETPLYPDPAQCTPSLQLRPPPAGWEAIAADTHTHTHTHTQPRACTHQRLRATF
jgi:hypothetical protein